MYVLLDNEIKSPQILEAISPIFIFFYLAAQSLYFKSLQMLGMFDLWLRLLLSGKILFYWVYLL